MVSLSMLSSFGQLASERLGRSYGGGVLKFELTDARRLPILLRRSASVDSAFLAADVAIRAGDMTKARQAADELLLPAVFGDDWKIAAAEMFAEASQMRNTRRVNG